MILDTLDALTSQGSQIVLASDRPPADIDGLDSRLVSRFSGGLIVDIAPPEFETRVAIIRRKADDAGQTLEPGVAEALGRRRYRNVRELTGALNRVVAVQELEERRLGPEDVPALLGPMPRDEPFANEGNAPAGPDGALGSFLTEVSDALSQRIGGEEPWRRAVREAAEQGDREGFAVDRLLALTEAEDRPPDWEDRLRKFQRRVARLREIREELDRLGNPWRETTPGLVRDPDRMDEAEAFLASAREQARPFPVLAAGPSLDELREAFPTLALRAAEQMASGERPRYNPLYLWSSGPEAPESLLAAAGRTFQQAAPGKVIAVTSVSDFSQDFIRALSGGVAGAWRERWWTVDLLLVHGVQDLTGTERAQEEFFHLFEALKRRGARVLLAADRPPHEIRGIDERLRSRFEGGLVLEVEAPDFLPVSDPLAVEPAPERVPDRVSAKPSQGTPPLPAGPGDPSLVGTGPTAGGRGAGPAPGEPWRPARDRVVWAWVPMEDRLLEELS
jgi:hypothetical protein